MHIYLAILLAAAVAAVVTRVLDSRTQSRVEVLEEQRKREVIGDEGTAGLHARIVGWTQGFGNYDMVSLDKGRTWWNLSADRATLTPADPALVARLRSFKALAANAAAHGAIDPSRMSADESKLLADAGILVGQEQEAH